MLRAVLLVLFIIPHWIPFDAGTCPERALMGLRAQSQAVIDSLEADFAARDADDSLRVVTLVNLWREVQNNDAERATGYARRIIAESVRMGNPTLEATGYQRLGITLDYRGLPDSALYYYGKALDIYRAKGDTVMQGIMLYNTAGIHHDAGRYDSTLRYLAEADARFTHPTLLVQRSAVNKLAATIKRERADYAGALEHALLAYDLARQANNPGRMADADSEIAFAYSALGDTLAEAKYHARAFRTLMADDDFYYAAVSALNLAGTFQKLEQRDSAFHYANQANDLIRRGGFTELEVDAHNTLGSLYLQFEDYEAAEREYLAATKTLRDQGGSRTLPGMLISLAQAQQELGRLDRATNHAREGLDLALEMNLPETVNRGRARLALLAAARGNYREAYQQMVLRQDSQDSLHQINVDERVAELTARFEREKQDRVISEQEARLALLESQAKVDLLQLIGLILGLTAVAVLLVLVWFTLRERNRRLVAESERLNDDLQAHQRELSAHAVQMARKSRLLDQLGGELEQIRGERPDDRKRLDGLLRGLQSEERIDQDWDNFRTYFQGVHGDFEERLKAAAAAKLSPREQRLAALIRMQLNNQEIGSILGVSQDSLYKAKYRLRKKLPAAGEGELDQYIQSV